MPREAKLFESANGSPARALFKLRGQHPAELDSTCPRLAQEPRARSCRVDEEVAEVVEKADRRRTPRLKLPTRKLRALLKAWELADPEGVFLQRPACAARDQSGRRDQTLTQYGIGLWAGCTNKSMDQGSVRVGFAAEIAR